MIRKSVWDTLLARDLIPSAEHPATMIPLVPEPMTAPVKTYDLSTTPAPGGVFEFTHRGFVAIMTMDHGIGSPSARGVAPRQGGRRWPPRELENTGETWPRRTERIDSTEWPACPRSPRRPTRRNGTTPDNQRSLLRPLPAGVRSAQRWRKTEALSPRATARVRRRRCGRLLSARKR